MLFRSMLQYCCYIATVSPSTRAKCSPPTDLPSAASHLRMPRPFPDHATRGDDFTLTLAARILLISSIFCSKSSCCHQLNFPRPRQRAHTSLYGLMTTNDTASANHAVEGELLTLVHSTRPGFVYLSLPGVPS